MKSTAKYEKRFVTKQIAFCLLIFILTLYPQATFSRQINNLRKDSPDSQNFLRSELYFGMSKTDASIIRDDDWNNFLEREVTVRFPSGFTVLEGFGQFRESSGKIVREKCKVLILLYPAKDKRKSRQKIEQIRQVYMRDFQLQSVLRLDFQQPVKVLF